MSFIQLCYEEKIEEIERITKDTYLPDDMRGTVNEKTHNDNSALHILIEKIHYRKETNQSYDNLLKIIDLILNSENFDEVNLCCKKYERVYTAFHLACIHDLCDVAKKISEHPKFDSLFTSSHLKYSHDFDSLFTSSHLKYSHDYDYQYDYPHRDDGDLDKYPYLPIDFAAMQGYVEIVKLILNHPKFDNDNIVEWNPERTLNFAKPVNNSWSDQDAKTLNVARQNVVNAIKEHPKYITRPELVKKHKEDERKKKENEKVIEEKKIRARKIEQTGCYEKEKDLINIDLYFEYYATKEFFKKTTETRFAFEYNGITKKIHKQTPKYSGNCDVTFDTLIKELNEVNKQGYDISMTILYYYDNSGRYYNKIHNPIVAKQVLNDIAPENKLVDQCSISSGMLLRWNKA
jgi:hypothetical protein